MIKLEFAKNEKIGVRGKLNLMSNNYTFMQLFCGWNLPGKFTLVVFQNISISIILFLTIIFIITLFGLLFIKPSYWRNFELADSYWLLALTREDYNRIDGYSKFSSGVGEKIKT